MTQNYEQALTHLTAIGVQPGETVKTCNKCLETKPFSEFGKHKTSANGLNPSCRECHNKKQRNKRGNQIKSQTEILNKKEYDAKRFASRHHKYFNDPLVRARNLYANAKYRAKQKGIEFSVCFARIHIALIVGICEKSGIPFDLEVSEKGFKKAFSPSIDRIDNDQGYTDANTQVVCTAYNLGKGVFPENDFIALCIAIAEKQKAKDCAKF